MLLFGFKKIKNGKKFFFFLITWFSKTSDDNYTTEFRIWGTLIFLDKENAFLNSLKT